jgi:hypothetical protein
MTNSLVDNIFIQYKFFEYDIENRKEEFDNFTTTNNYIVPISGLSYEESYIELEPTIQYLSSLKLPTNWKDEISFSLKLTKKYGFLKFKNHIKKYENLNFFNELLDKEEQESNKVILDKAMSNAISTFKGESVYNWVLFVKNLKFMLRAINSYDFYENSNLEDRLWNTDFFNESLKNVYPIYDIESGRMKLNTNDFGSAILLSILNNKNYLKSCIYCNGMYFAKRSDSKYCSNNCAKNYQRNN